MSFPSNTSNDAAWYYAHNRRKVGPGGFAELKQLATDGQLLPTDMLLEAGTQKWFPAAGVEGLFGVHGKPEAETISPDLARHALRNQIEAPPGRETVAYRPDGPNPQTS